MSTIVGIFHIYKQDKYNIWKFEINNFTSLNLTEESSSYMKRKFEEVHSGFIQASLSKIKGLFKDLSRLSYSFQGLKV